MDVVVFISIVVSAVLSRKSHFKRNENVQFDILKRKIANNCFFSKIMSAENVCGKNA
jgi:hypothetical protein